ncbi:hypothetical protein PGB90_006671 [Kerria lacca]
MNWMVLFVFKITTIFYISHSSVYALVPIAPVSSTVNHSQVPQYRFHYYVKDEKTGDYKAQEEHRTGDSVTGSYMVGEPNGDLRVVTYIADVSNGFKADVSVHPGGSPLKNHTSNVPKEGIAAFNNYRSGISAPPKNRKPIRGFNPIIVKSLPSLGTQPVTNLTPQTELSTTTTPSSHPYPYYKDAQLQQNISTVTAFETSSTTSKKSIQVDLMFNDDTVVEQNEKSTVLSQHRKSELTSTEANFMQLFSYVGTDTANTLKNNATNSPHITSNGLYQLRNMDIPSSVMEILNQNKDKSNVTPATVVNPIQSNVNTIKPGTTNELYQEPESLKIDLTQSINENTHSIESTTLRSTKKITLPQRPMRLIGLSPIFIDTSQLQTITENLTSIPQVHFEPFTNMQYATPAPFHSGPLQGGPAGPFRNLPRSVSETNSEFSLINAVPIVNSIPISAPIISQQFTSAAVKPELKLDNKTPTSAHPLPLCSDCFLPTNYMPYPLLKPPTSPVSGNNQKTPCPSTNAVGSPYWTPYMPSFAYILMPAPMIKNKINETRSFIPGQDIWKK